MCPTNSDGAHGQTVPRQSRSPPSRTLQRETLPPGLDASSNRFCRRKEFLILWIPLERGMTLRRERGGGYAVPFYTAEVIMRPRITYTSKTTS